MGKRYYSLIIFLLISRELIASSCCGSGGSSTQLMIADNNFEATLTSSFKKSIGETNNIGQSTFYNSDVKDDSFFQKLELKNLLSEKIQIGTGIGFESKKIRKSGKENHSNGLTDISFSLNYEAISDNNYSVYLPRTFVGLRVNYPFGKNIYTAQKEHNADVRGNGYKQIGASLVFIKYSYQLSLLPTLTPSQNKTPSFMSNSIGIQKSFSKDAFNYGLGIKWNYTQEKKGLSKSIQNFDNSFFINYTIDQNYSLGFTYLDNSLLGTNRNSNLYREYAFNLSWINPL